MFSLISGLPSSLSAIDCSTLFEWFIGNTPLSDSSGTFMRALRPKPSPAVLLLVSSGRLRGLPVLVHEASRRVWGLRLRRTGQELGLSPLFMLPSAHINRLGVQIGRARCRERV